MESKKAPQTVPSPRADFSFCSSFSIGHFGYTSTTTSTPSCGLSQSLRRGRGVATVR